MELTTARTRKERAGRKTMAKKGDRSAALRGEGKCQQGICGGETACRDNPEENVYECICPHDQSIPTPDFKCPNRKTVSARPAPIAHIIPPTHGNPAIASQLTSNVTSQPRTLADNRTQVAAENLHLPFVEIVLLCSVGVIVLVSLTVIWFKRQALMNLLGRSRTQRKAASCSTSPRNLNKSLFMATRYAANPQYSTGMPVIELPEIPPPIVHCTVPLISRISLNLHQELGEGCFGKVFRGELIDVGGADGMTQQVAVKVLKKSASREAEEDFMREVEIMSGFRHANILTLLGIVQRDGEGEPWMVFEFMAHGDLAEVLRANSKQLWRPVPGLPTLGPAALYSVALQVAAGMCYLAAQHFVHRDLACRNCLVGAGLVIKIADFGMSRDVYTCDYYKIGGSRMLPVRWMSPESVMFGRFTLESDVWSYGVVLWEIFSFGRQPYYGHSNEEVVKLIYEGIMLIPPEDCPTMIRDLMRCCWKTDPRDRIKFPEIHDKLAKAAASLTPTPTSLPPLPVTCIDTNLPLPPNDINISNELLDAESYLLPNTVIPPEYLETIP